mmetsp:Transcript_30318/g.48609  ORF Transcript_30318/g.48609 Transcript_30318/m.48609 type:complete len:135 (-) Transcript_30318:606-1010(-)
MECIGCLELYDVSPIFAISPPRASPIMLDSATVLNPPPEGPKACASLVAVIDGWPRAVTKAFTDGIPWVSENVPGSRIENGATPPGAGGSRSMTLEESVNTGGTSPVLGDLGSSSPPPGVELSDRNENGDRERR